LGERLRKLFLILMISLILEEDAYAYNCLFWVLEFMDGALSFSLKNFDFSKTFLLSLRGTGEGILENSMLFIRLLEFVFFSGLPRIFFSMNLAKIHYKNDLLLLSAFNASYPTL